MWVAELKSGKKNREILDAMRDFEPSAGWHQLHDKIKEWDDTMFEQAFRILRQQQRMANVNKIINTNICYDNALKKEVHISEETYFFQSYEDKLITLFERIKSGAKWAIEVTYKNRLIKVATPKGFYYMGGGMYGKILFDFYYPVASLQPLT